MRHALWQCDFGHRTSTHPGGVEDDQTAAAAGVVMNIGHEPTFALTTPAGDKVCFACMSILTGVPFAQNGTACDIQMDDSGGIQGVRVLPEARQPSMPMAAPGEPLVVHGELQRSRSDHLFAKSEVTAAGFEMPAAKVLPGGM